MTSAAPGRDGPIRIAAAILRRPDGRILLVRKHGTAAFIQPGGKLEPGETAALALARELHEELGLVVDPRRLTLLGRFTAAAANEPGRLVEADLFRLDHEGAVAPAAEIAEAAWTDPRQPGGRPLADLTRDHVLPLAASMGPDIA